MLSKILLTKPNECISLLKILKKIGEGSNGSVHHICILKDCKYILKVINYNNSKDLKFILNEINTQYILNNKYPKNIPFIKSFFIGTKEINENINNQFKSIRIKKNVNYVYLIMEYLESYNTLTDYLNKLDNNNQISKSYKLLTNISNFISKVNSENIIHGDLHTDNIMVNKGGTKFYLIDFGYSVNLKLKDNININNIPNKLLYTFDLWKFVSDLEENYKIEYNVLCKILVPNIKDYLENYEKIHNSKNIWYSKSL